MLPKLALVPMEVCARVAGAWAITALLLGCGDASGPRDASPTLRILTSTTGVSPDPDGYSITDRGAGSLRVASHGQVLVHRDPGSYTLTIGDLSPNCSVEGGQSRTVMIHAGDSLQSVAFDVTCTRADGTVKVSTDLVQPGPYLVTLDGWEQRWIGGTDSTTFGELADGVHVVVLADSIGRPLSNDAFLNPVHVPIAGGDTGVAAFHIPHKTGRCIIGPVTPDECAP